jgi:hypothetical protein
MGLIRIPPVILVAHFFAVRKWTKTRNAGTSCGPTKLPKKSVKKRGKVDPKKVTKSRNKKPKRVKPLISSDEDEVKPQMNVI